MTGIPIIGEKNPQLRQAQVRDRLGRVLHEGDLLTLHTPHPPIFKVERIEPYIQPGIPPGTMRIICTSVAPFFAQRDEGNMEFLRVQEATPRGPLVEGESPDAPPEETKQ